MNSLSKSASSYLRTAAHQPVQWHAWGDEPFELAQKEQKPILLDIGAVWCHWCHVMDRESYEDAALAAIINEHFIAIKVDRDERPDVDARYQAAVSAISGQGGWPLTGFLTPEGKPYFGGTYFPRDDRYGRPGFARVLLTMASVWRDRREEALDSAASVMSAIEENEAFSGRGGALNHELSEKIAASALKQFDARHGGFGSQPKFPHPAALDLLMQIAARGCAQQAEILTAVSTTLLKMGRGGVYDQLAGGFHRYSVDERWIVPHFEKMLYDNAALLANYVHATRILKGDVASECAERAREINHWLDATMTDREHGGFYTSQDADINLEDDGDYFTWTLEETREALADDVDALNFAIEYWDIRELGEMHHDPQKNVLHVQKTLAEIAAKGGQTIVELNALLKRARTRMLAVRAERPTPFIDKTLYTSWNAMAISAYLDAARGLGNAQDFSAEEKAALQKFALKSFDRLLAAAYKDKTLSHVIAYHDGSASTTTPGTLDDYAMTLHAALDAWSATGEMRYYRVAESLADALATRFFESSENGLSGAFNDTDGSGHKLGALSARRRPLQDSPTPAGNPTAAAALLRIAALNGSAEYRVMAFETLESFSGIVEHFGLYVGSYGLALERLLAEPHQLVIVGNDAIAAEMESLAAKPFTVARTIIRLTQTAELPPALAETIGQMPAQAKTFALLCNDRTCLPPVYSTAELKISL